MIDQKPQSGVSLVLRRKGFTLIELLVVIAIIAILVTLLIMGVRSMTKSSHEKATRTMMENLKSLIVERRNNGGMDAVYNLYKYNPPPPPPSYPYGQPLPIPSNPVGTPIGVPGNVQADAADRMPAFATPSPPDPKDEIARTWLVMNLLRSVKTNSDMLLKLPAEDFLKVPSNPVPPPSLITTPIPVDGWNNPMIFVPGGGINVTVTGPGGTVGKLVTAPDGKGFWASAGPDGIFTDTVNSAPNQKPYGDDNVYSFEN